MPSLLRSSVSYISETMSSSVARSVRFGTTVTSLTGIRVSARPQDGTLSDLVRFKRTLMVVGMYPSRFGVGTRSSAVAI